jgi:phage terminase small subunit
MAVLKNSRHEAFARAVVEGKSEREAYQRAGYRGKPGGKRSGPADAAAARLLKNVQVAARIAELKGDAARASTSTAARVLDELAKLAFSNMLNYMTIGADSQPRLDFSALTRDHAAAIHQLVVETRTEEREKGPPAVIVKTRFKLADKRGPLVDLGKHLGLFKERVEHSGPDGGPVEVKHYTDIEAVRLIGRFLKKVDDANPPKTAGATDEPGDREDAPATTDPATTESATTDPSKEAGEGAAASPPEGGGSTLVPIT